MTTSYPNGLSQFTQVLLRVLVLAAAAVLMASLLVAGVLLALVHGVISLLRGRRPIGPTLFMGPLRHMQRRGFRPAPAPKAGREASNDDSAVVEGQARELL